MSFFRRPDYQSDVTQFIEALKEKNPQLPAQQQAGRALLWSPSINRELQKEFADAKIAQAAYVYQTK